MFRTRALAVAAIATTALALTACGSDSLSAGSSSSASATTSAKAPTVDAALVAKLPAKIKDAGTINIGTDATYQPNEYLDADGKTVDRHGRRPLRRGDGQVRHQDRTGCPPAFDAIILGVQSGKYDVGVSSFTVNAEREKQATMVSYFKAGTQWVTQKGNPKGINPDDACGKNVGVQKGTVQADDDLAQAPGSLQGRRQARRSTSLVDADQAKVTAAVQSGKADAMLVDLPPALAAVDATGGTLELLGDQYDSAPYGYVLPKDASTDFGAAIVEALKSLKADGTYDQILTKWKTQQRRHQRLRREPDGQLTP